MAAEAGIAVAPRIIAAEIADEINFLYIIRLSSFFLNYTMSELELQRNFCDFLMKNFFRGKIYCNYPGADQQKSSGVLQSQLTGFPKEKGGQDHTDHRIHEAEYGDL